MSNNDDVKNPSYNYTKIVKEPTEMGVSSDKGVENYERDFASMVKYVELLTSGGSGSDSASNLKDGQTIGDSYFLASSTVFLIILGSEAWKPQATFAASIKGMISSSSAKE